MHQDAHASIHNPQLSPQLTPPLDPAINASDPAPASDRRALLAGLGLLTAGALLTRKSEAGPLSPPPGPVSSTPGPEPRIPVSATTTPGTASAVFAITQPGSYYLTGNIQSEAGKNAIEIRADNVTLDLNGYRVQGVPNALNGILVEQGAAASIFNGIVGGFVEGVNAQVSNAGVMLRDLIFYRNTVNGVSATSASVTRCRFAENGGTGCMVRGAAIVTDCVSENNGEHGFSSGTMAHFSNCLSLDNGLEGFSCVGNAELSHCISQGNAIGFRSIGSASLVDCFATDNTQSGIELIDNNAGSIIRGCTARFNGQNGILVSSGALVQGNTCFRNGASRAGIRATGSDNRIEGNNCIRAGLGIEVNGTGNFIARNTCSGNTTANYSIAAGNALATIFSASNNASAINGSTYTGNLGSTDPNANFTY